VHFIPLHIHPYYRDTYAYQPEDFPTAYGEYLREISLPIYSKMSDQDVQDVIDAVREVVGGHSVENAKGCGEGATFPTISTVALLLAAQPPATAQ
jgi:hypothetical protein